MAQYFEDFSAEILGASPSSLASEYETPMAFEVVSGNLLGSSSKKVLLDTSSPAVSFSRQGASYNKNSITSSGKTTVLLLGESLIGNFLGGIVSGGFGSARRGYAQIVRTGDQRLFRYSGAGGENTLGSTSGPSSSLSGASYYFTFWYEIIRSGALIEKRWWDFTTGARPAAAQISVTDSSPLAEGWIGISSLTNPAAATDQWIHSIAVGTNGDPAPTGPITPSLNAPINLGTTNLLATSARLNWEQG